MALQDGAQRGRGGSQESAAVLHLEADKMIQYERVYVNGGASLDGSMLR